MLTVQRKQKSCRPFMLVPTEISFYMLQVSFVFTNQVEGKLVPIESTVRPKIDEVNENKNRTSFRKTLHQRAVLSCKHERTSPSISLNRDSIERSFNLKPLPQPHSKLKRTLEGKTKVTVSPKISPGIQIPSNFLSPASITDDDFQ